MKIAGKILFVIGLILNILMVFFGFWPSLIYVIIMLAGAGMFSLNKKNQIKKISLYKITEELKPLFRFPVIRIDSEAINSLIKTIFLSFLGIATAILLFILLSKDYFRESNTRHDCQVIVTTLTDYFKVKNKYPDSLSAIIQNNPTKQGWYKDYWNNNYFYKPENAATAFTLISRGKDGKINTSDDLIFKQTN